MRAVLVLALLTLASSAPTAAQPSEALSPDNATMVMVDYLTGFRPGLQTVDWDTYQDRVVALSKTVSLFGLPTIVLGDEGGFRGEFFASIDEYFPDAPRIARATPSAWREPAFREQVEAYGNRKLILAGISIDNCTLLTSLDALRAGYEVYVVTDVSGTTDQLVEDTAMMRLQAAGATLITWVTLGSELLLEPTWESPEGQALGKIYDDHSAWGGR